MKPSIKYGIITAIIFFIEVFALREGPDLFLFPALFFGFTYSMSIFNLGLMAGKSWAKYKAQKICGYSVFFILMLIMLYSLLMII